MENGQYRILTRMTVTHYHMQVLKMPNRLLSFVFALGVFAALPGMAAERSRTGPLDEYIEPKNYICYRATAAVKIDGKLDDRSWENVPWTEDFVDIEGERKPKPQYRTRVKMLWDDMYFYIAAEMEEPHVWGTLTKHDSVIFHDNDFEVFIDPDGDNHNYGEFEINPLNTGWDLRLPKPYKDGGKAQNSWEIPGLKKAIAIDGTLNDPTDTDRKWTVELAFPWKVLSKLANRSKPPRDGDQWRVNFSRVQWRHTIVKETYRKVPNEPEDNWVWSPQGVINMHRPETWGLVQFSTGIIGQTKFRKDRTIQARYLLHRIYYAQRDFRHRNKRWAKSLTELKAGDLTNTSLANPITMHLTKSGFTAVANVGLPNERTTRLSIHQDSRLETFDARSKK